MLGRVAYHQPWELAEVDFRIHGAPGPAPSREAAVELLLPYIADQLQRGTGLARITRHMLGLFHGQPGGRLWRRVLSEEAHRPGAGLGVVRRALAAVANAQLSATAA